MKKHKYEIQLTPSEFLFSKPCAARVTGVRNSRLDLELIHNAATGRGIPRGRFKAGNGLCPEFYFEDGYENSIKFKADKSERIFVQAGRAKCRDTEYFVVSNGCWKKIDRQDVINHFESN